MFQRIAFVLLLSLLAGCSALGVQPTTDSGVEGQALIGPMCPVVREGESCPDQPYQATITITTSSGRKVTRFQTDEDGRFHVPLAPGDYILHPESPGAMPFAADMPFTVRPGEFTDIIVSYDSGIR